MDIVNPCGTVLEPEDGSKGSDKNYGSVNRFSNGKSFEVKYEEEKFVENLLNEGSKIPCDDTSDAFNNNLKLPPYFDEKLFKKGQEFFHKHMFSFFLSKFVGLMALLTIPSMEILVLTNMSGTEMTAYKRYVATIFHMCLWYNQDFRPGSRAWNSIITVRGLHNSASKRSSVCLKYRITQKDMALTQFGFMGFALVRSKMVGIYHSTEDEFRAFIHLWRIVGCVLGIEERFNVCKESVRETKEICNLLIDKVFLHTLRDPPNDFENMSNALINGMWATNPAMEPEVFKLYLEMLLEDNSDPNGKPAYNKLGPVKKFRLGYIQFTMWLQQFAMIRIIYNSLQILTLWFLKNFPFLAYYKFGKVNSHVAVE